MLSVSVEDLGLTDRRLLRASLRHAGPVHVAVHVRIARRSARRTAVRVRDRPRRRVRLQPRSSMVPTEMNEIDSFVLVSAIDDSSLANDPMRRAAEDGARDPSDAAAPTGSPRASRLTTVRAGQQHGGRRDRARPRLRDRRARRQPDGAADRGLRAGQRRARAEGALQLRGRRAVGAGAAHRQLLHLQP